MRPLLSVDKAATPKHSTPRRSAPAAASGTPDTSRSTLSKTSSIGLNNLGGQAPLTPVSANPTINRRKIASSILTPDVPLSHAIDLSSDEEKPAAGSSAGGARERRRSNSDLSPRKSPSKRLRHLPNSEDAIRTPISTVKNPRHLEQQGSDEPEISVVFERSLSVESQIQATGEDEYEDFDDDSYDDGTGFVVPDSLDPDHVAAKSDEKTEKDLNGLFSDSDGSESEIVPLQEPPQKQRKGRPQPNIYASKRITEFVAPPVPEKPQNKRSSVGRASPEDPKTNVSSTSINTTDDQVHSTPSHVPGSPMHSSSSERSFNNSTSMSEPNYDDYFEGMTSNELTNEIIVISNGLIDLLKERLLTEENTNLSATVKAARRALKAPEFAKLSRLHERGLELLEELKNSGLTVVQSANQKSQQHGDVLPNSVTNQHVSAYSENFQASDNTRRDDIYMNDLVPLPEPDINFDVRETREQYISGSSYSGYNGVEVTTYEAAAREEEATVSKYFGYERERFETRQLSPVQEVDAAVETRSTPNDYYNTDSGYEDIADEDMDNFFKDPILIDDDARGEYINPAKQMTHGGVYDRSDKEMQYPWSEEVCQVLSNVFRLPGFRKNQLEAINATLSGKDVFVLMPTGGGKSLCYQLPALVFGGKTKGTTIVISPLISLMQDQVAHLIEKGIRAGMINSRGDLDDRKSMFRLLNSGDLSLLYISPEMLNTSGQLKSSISRLHSNGQLARIVIDEAHCVSSWGHDFRPDYKELKMFKQQYPDVPMIALTATANDRVQLDVMHNLELKNPAVFKQSFNRPNLFYEVREKSKDVLPEIRDLLTVKYPGKSGIIYCHSKMSCEQTASKLQQFGLRVTHYHAGMTPDERMDVQTKWQEGSLQAICATIAFGMGIDKANVRFVVHYTLPRNLEGYYQETGRAGRDGLYSECILYYAYRDASTMMTMIDRDECDFQTKEKQRSFLKQVVQYCENKTDCRRLQVLRYFNETFDSAECHKSCDNCRSSNSTDYEDRDVTEVAKNIIRVVRQLQNENVTMLYCMDVFRGAKTAKIQNANHDGIEGYGAGKGLDRIDIERIFHHLVTVDALKEMSSVNKAGFASSYLKTGGQASAFLSGLKNLTMQFPKKGTRPKTTTPRVSASSRAAAGSASARPKSSAKAVRATTKVAARGQFRKYRGKPYRRRTQTV
ncbi:hypothetical protein BZA70DRAFT_289077 [Myxozyma melibiosi]|uniref:DNA 3'-5' helicase n=1 Tax=Myxozyma melibiosi TaxID=54550 RepID=A0ABR1F7S5_9ASCO